MSVDKQKTMLPEMPDALSAAQRRWFYSANLGALVVLYLSVQQSFLPPALATAWIPAFVISALLWLSSFSPQRMKYEALAPIVLGGFLIVIVHIAYLLRINIPVSLVAMVLLAIILAKPFGVQLFLSFSIPSGLALAWGVGQDFGIHESISLVTLLIAVGVYLHWPALQGSHSAKASNSEASDRLHDRLRREEEKSQELQRRLVEREMDFEREIQEQTKFLRDANTQLSEQIGLRKTIGDALVKSQTRLTQAIDASKLGLIDWDIKVGQFYQSAFHEHFGKKEQTSEEVVSTLKEVVHPEDYPFVRDTLNQCLNGKLNNYSLQYRVVEDHSATEKSEKGNAWCWIEECGKVVDQGPDGRADRILGTRRNIQAQVERDEQVRLAKSVFDHTSEGVYVLDPNGRYLSVNPAYVRMMNCRPEDLVGHSIITICDTPSREEVYQQIFSDLRKEGTWQGELLEKQLHGDYFHQRTELNVIRNDSGEVQYLSGMLADITDSKAADEKLDYLLNYDDLTKLANRVQFLDQLHRALVRFKDEARPFALVLLDVDRFKQFNDSFGHARADKLLEAIAERLSGNVQSVDILARVGGNEFACIVECSETFSVDRFAQRLFKAVTSASYEVDGHPVVLSCSVGVALVPEHTENIQSLMRYGALAVQKAKYHGGNQIQLFDESLKSFSRRRLEMEHALRDALENRELEVFYQPKLDLKLNRITSYEALIRWEHPTLGLISPEEFVNIAEENGLISDLGAFVLKEACTQTRSWMESSDLPLHVSVNLSARQLRDADFLTVVSDTIRESGLPSDSLELELTESAIMEDLDGALSILRNIRELGVKVSVDDFGTGYSSLSYLKSLPVDTLKIDRSFIDGMEASIQQQAIVKAIVVLGSSLDLQIVAEGVENDAQLHILQALGCDLIQGYHVSKPLKAEAMGALLPSHN